MAQPKNWKVAAACSLLSPQKKRANRSLRTVGSSSSFLLPRRLCHSEGGRVTCSACAPGQGQKVVKNLAGRRRTRTPKRPARHVIDRVDALPRGQHDRVLAVRDTLHCQCPTAVQHVQTADHKSDGRKSCGKQCKRR